MCHVSILLSRRFHLGQIVTAKKVDENATTLSVTTLSLFYRFAYQSRFVAAQEFVVLIFFITLHLIESIFFVYVLYCISLQAVRIAKNLFPYCNLIFATQFISCSYNKYM